MLENGCNETTISEIEKETLNPNVCPVCSHNIGVRTSTNNYCSNCGIRLDWIWIQRLKDTLTNREKCILFCKNKTTNDDDYLQQLKHNLYVLEHDQDDFEGCPSCFGLESSYKQLCGLEELKYDDLPSDQQDLICKQCWDIALSDNVEDDKTKSKDLEV